MVKSGCLSKSTKKAKKLKIAPSAAYFLGLLGGVVVVVLKRGCGKIGEPRSIIFDRE